MTESVPSSQITDEQVSGETGRVWSEWTTILDHWDGEKSRLVPMVDYLMDYHYVRRFWAQIIAKHGLKPQGACKLYDALGKTRLAPKKIFA